MEHLGTFLGGVATGAAALALVYVYLQRNNISIPTPEQAEIIVKEVIWAIRSAQQIYGGSAARATEAETLATKQLAENKLTVPAPLLRLIIRIVYHVIKPELTQPTPPAAYVPDNIPDHR